MRARSSGSVIRSPSASTYVKPLPCLRRVRPGEEQSARRSRGDMTESLPGVRRNYFFAPALAREEDFFSVLAFPLDLPSDLLLAGLGVLDRGEARLERRHQVGHLLRLRLLRLDGDLLAVRLALDQLEDLLAVLVVVLRRLEVRGQRVDQLLGHLELAVRGLEVLRLGHVVEVVGGHDLVVEDHRLHRQHVAGGGADRDELLLGAQHDARDRHLAGLAHRLEQQRVGLARALVGDEVVRVVVEDRVDVLEVDEVLDVDRARLLGRDRVELLGRDDDVALLGQLEALDDLLVGHLLLRHRVDPLLGDPVAGVGVELMEADGLARDRREELDGHVDEPE